MKEMDKYTDRDWEELAARLSGESTGNGNDLYGTFSPDDPALEKWQTLGKIKDSGSINVDRAWSRVRDRISEEGLVVKEISAGTIRRRIILLRIAAAALILVAVGTVTFYLLRDGSDGEKVITAGNDERNIEVYLPDGSMVWLNRNSSLSWNEKRYTENRAVSLKGEAYFKINHSEGNPFIVDAGKANIKVLGTSFNVITSNSRNEVEVFVETGKVMLSDSSGSQSMVIDPGYIGTVGSLKAAREINENRNYMSWKTDLLVFNGQDLETVFTDLRRVFNINFTSDDPEVMKLTLAATFDRQPQDTIIRIICTTFNLSYEKDGDYYRLSKK